MKPKIYSPLTILLLTVGLFHCGKSKTLEIIPEPVVDQVSVISPEICLDSYVWIIPANPCISIKGEKDNTTSKTRYLLVYTLSAFDVEFPLGVSIRSANQYHNLTKVSTEYGSTLQLVSDLPETVVKQILQANQLGISYTNRKETRNQDLSKGQTEKLQSYTKKIQELLAAEAKMKIQK